MKRSRIKGKFIVLEGIDGAGTEVESKELIKYFKKKKVSSKRIYYPDYSEPVGNLIHEYLHGKYDFPVEVQFLLYFIDFVKDVEKINKWLKEGKVVIADRYFTSALAYQGLGGFPQKKALKIAELFKLVKPDLIIYLKVSPETSIKRKFKEKNSLDRNEKNKKLLFEVDKSYQKLIKNNVFGKWVVVNGEDSIKEVFENIKNIINKKYET